MKYIFYYFLKFILLGPIIKVLLRPQVTGTYNFPHNTSVIIVSNHRSFLDSFLIALYAPRPVMFFAKSEYFEGKMLKGFFMRIFFKLLNQIPIYRNNPYKSKLIIDKTIQGLTDKNILAIYPEGKRSPNGCLFKGHIGVAHLLLSSDALAVPIVIKKNNSKKGISSLYKVGIEILEPIKISSQIKVENKLRRNKFIMRSIVDNIMFIIYKHSNQTYIDMYASKYLSK